MQPTDDPRHAVSAYVEAFNRGDIDALCACFTPDALVHGVLGWGGIPQVRPIWQELITAFGLQLAPEAMIVEGAHVAVRYRERGTFRAAFRHLPPTGKSYEIAAMEWFEIVGGKIHRRWGARDSAALFRQLGSPLP